LTRLEIMMAGRHGQGTEKFPASAIRASVPTKYGDTKEFLVMRYDGLRPMAGVRSNDVFQVLWIETSSETCATTVHSRVPVPAPTSLIRLAIRRAPLAGWPWGRRRR
jgi:hypothetical protein